MKKKSPFTTPSERIKLDYGRAINRLIARQLPLFPGKSIEETLLALDRLMFEERYLERFARKLGERMITMVSRANARNWREAAMKASRGRAIYEALRQEMRGPVGERVRELVEENAKLISGIPVKLRESVNLEIATWQQEGLRPEAIAQNLRMRIPQLTKTKARLIARTETSKAATALSESRSEQLGIAWYQWATAEDQRVRKSHRNMDKVLVPWNDAPAPELLIGEESEGHYHAGEIYNCRCDAQPVVSLNVIEFPVRVYWRGGIERMTRQRFMRIWETQAYAQFQMDLVGAAQIPVTRLFGRTITGLK